MANATNTVDLDMLLADFLAVPENAEIFVAKQDEQGRAVPGNLLHAFHGRLTQNRLEDIVLRLVERVGQEQAFQGILRLGAGRVRYGTVDPEGNVAAEPGSAYFRNNGGAGQAFLKATGTGTSGWVEIGASVSITDVDPTLVDLDLTALSTVALANGSFPIGSLPFVADDATLAGAGSGLVAGTGLSLRAPTSAGNTWTVASQAAPHLYMPAIDIPGFRPGEDTLIVDIHLGAASVYEQGNDAFRIGLWGLVNEPLTGAAARARIMDRGNHGGVQTLRTFDGTNVGSVAVDLSSFNAYSVIIPPAGDMVLGWGTYSGGWPTRFEYGWRFGSVLTTNDVLSGEDLRLVIAWINSSDASPTSRGDLAHLRLRKKF